MAARQMSKEFGAKDYRGTLSECWMFAAIHLLKQYDINAKARCWIFCTVFTM